jgi:hypothetical protein
MEVFWGFGGQGFLFGRRRGKWKQGNRNKRFLFWYKLFKCHFTVILWKR